MTRPYCHLKPTRVTPGQNALLFSSEPLRTLAVPLHHLSMLVVPTLILPRDEELEILGRTVERSLGRSVQSIDVIGRGM